MPPITQVLRIMARNTPISGEEWLEIIEVWRQRLASQFDSFTLKTFGQTTCLMSLGGNHGIELDSPEVSSKDGLNLKTQGIFGANFSNRVYRTGTVKNPFTYMNETHIFGGTLYIWGLTRKGQWVLATVAYDKRSDGYEKATQINIEASTLPEITSLCKVGYEEILRELGNQVRSWNEHRKMLHRISSDLVILFDAEQHLIALVPK